MIVAHEHCLAEDLELIRTPVSMSAINEEIQVHNPTGRLPTLVMADGTGLFDSRVICRFLDSIGAGPHLLPTDAAKLLSVLRAEALGHGLCELLVLWRNERARPPDLQSAAHLAAFAAKCGRTLDLLDAESDGRRNEPFDLGHIATGSALSYCDFRFPDLAWRSGRERLVASYADFAARPSAVATVPLG